MAGDIPQGYIYSDVLGWVSPDDPRWQALGDSATVTTLQARLQQAEAEAAAMRFALEQANGALRLDAMVKEDGSPYGTTTVALDAIDAALTTTAGTDLLDRLLVATDALDAQQTAEDVSGDCTDCTLAMIRRGGVCEEHAPLFDKAWDLRETALRRLKGE